MFVSTTVQAKRVKGKIIYDKDTIDVICRIPYDIIKRRPIYHELQYKFSYIGNSGEKLFLRPQGKVKEIRFVHKKKEICMIVKENTINEWSDSVFIKLEVDGKIKLYRFYKNPTAHPAFVGPNQTIIVSAPTSICLLQKENDILREVKSEKFREAMMNYFKACP